jgi:hypothetical protein
VAEWTFARGPAPTILSDRMAVLLDGADAERHARMLLSRGALTAPEEVLDALVAGGLLSAPRFCIAKIERDTLTAFVRGPWEIVVEDERWNVERFSGAGMRTWRELSVERVTRFAIVPDGDGDPREILAPAEGDREARPGPLSAGRLVWLAPGLAAPAEPETDRTAVYHEAFPEDLFAGVREEAAPPTAPTALPRADAPLAVPPVTPARFDELFGATRQTGVEAAAVREHPPAGDAVEDAAVEEPLSDVSAVLCPAGHPNAPARSACAVCGSPLLGARLARVPRPDLGRLVLPDGRTVPITGTIVLGRSPRAERTSAETIPVLVALGDASGDISRNHLRVTVDAWTVLVEDLGSTNGTMLTDAAGARRLRPGEPAIVSDGAVADLGGEVRVRFEGTP